MDETKVVLKLTVPQVNRIIESTRITPAYYSTQLSRGSIGDSYFPVDINALSSKAQEIIDIITTQAQDQDALVKDISNEFESKKEKGKEEK